MNGPGPLLAVGETMVLLTTAEVGRLRHASSLLLGVAGAESNVAIGARRLGCPAAWVGRVGDDELGELVVSRIRAEGVDVAGVVRDPGAPTSLMLKERRTAEMVRVRYYRRNGPGSRLEPGDLDPAQVAAAGLLHVTGITPALSDSARATVDHAIELARAAGVPVSFDLNYRSALWPPDQAAAVCRDLAARADIVFAGDDEAELLGLSGDRPPWPAPWPPSGPATPWSSWGSGGPWPPSTAGSTPSTRSRSGPSTRSVPATPSWPATWPRPWPAARCPSAWSPPPPAARSRSPSPATGRASPPATNWPPSASAPAPCTAEPTRGPGGFGSVAVAVAAA